MFQSFTILTADNNHQEKTRRGVALFHLFLAPRFRRAHRGQPVPSPLRWVQHGAHPRHPPTPPRLCFGGERCNTEIRLLT